MKAMIFAAGLGSRLGSITSKTPKALVKVAGKPMIEHVIIRLKSFGVTEAIINVHHFAHHVIDFIRFRNNFGLRIEFSEEEAQLLDTGGGLKKASWFFEDGNPFIVHNVDVLSNLDFNAMLTFHTACGSLATLAVSKRNSSRYFLFDEEMQLHGWENTVQQIKIESNPYNLVLTRAAFSGIHIINPRIFDYMSEEGSFSLVDTYMRLCSLHPIHGFNHPAEDWIDMGRPSDVQRASLLVKSGRFGSD